MLKTQLSGTCQDSESILLQQSLFPLDHTAKCISRPGAKSEQEQHTQHEAHTEDPGRLAMSP